MTALAILHRDEIIAQVERGAMLKAIAASIGVTPAAISNQLHDDPDYRKAREIGAEVRLEEQFYKIEAAVAPVDVSRAREGFKAAAWFAEREFPARWGAKVEHTNKVQPIFNVFLPGSAPPAVYSTCELIVDKSGDK